MTGWCPCSYLARASIPASPGAERKETAGKQKGREMKEKPRVIGKEKKTKQNHVDSAYESRNGIATREW